jgi:hypothetical protein
MCGQVGRNPNGEDFMDIRRIEQLHRALLRLVDSYKPTVELMEGALELLAGELALDSLTYFQKHSQRQTTPPVGQPSLIDRARFAKRFTESEQSFPLRRRDDELGWLLGPQNAILRFEVFQVAGQRRVSRRGEQSEKRVPQGLHASKIHKSLRSQE